jgi:membrane protease YdiL (CAAX protease family)
MTTVLLAVLTGIAVLLAGNVPWAGFGAIPGFARLNLTWGVALPWAILPTTLYLWAYWRVIGGVWPASSTSDSRRVNLRANRLPAGFWIPALAAGLVGFGALAALLFVAARLVNLPASAEIAIPPQMPLVTVVLLLAMGSIVAGVTEEAAFRGYMQSMIERQYGVVMAILVNGVLFGLLHFPNHPGDVLLMLPYYVAVSAVYGGLTWAVDSILPALVLHSAGDVLVLTRLWATGRPEWQLAASPPPLVWEHGMDAPFVLAAIACLVLAAVTIQAYRSLYHSRMTVRRYDAPAVMA